MVLLSRNLCITETAGKIKDYILRREPVEILSGNLPKISEIKNRSETLSFYTMKGLTWKYSMRNLLIMVKAEQYMSINRLVHFPAEAEVKNRLET